MEDRSAPGDFGLLALLPGMSLLGQWLMPPQGENSPAPSAVTQQLADTQQQSPTPTSGLQYLLAGTISGGSEAEAAAGTPPRTPTAEPRSVGPTFGSLPNTLTSDLFALGLPRPTSPRPSAPAGPETAARGGDNTSSGSAVSDVHIQTPTAPGGVNLNTPAAGGTTTVSKVSPGAITRRFGVGPTPIIGALGWRYELTRWDASGMLEPAR